MRQALHTLTVTDGPMVARRRAEQWHKVLTEMLDAVGAEKHQVLLPLVRELEDWLARERVDSKRRSASAGAEEKVG